MATAIKTRIFRLRSILPSTLGNQPGIGALPYLSHSGSGSKGVQERKVSRMRTISGRLPVLTGGPQVPTPLVT
jgi:hypothetical protein